MSPSAPDFGDPALVAELAAWRATDAELGGYATIVSQRARIAELESEVDRVVARWQFWELEALRLEAELRERTDGPSSATDRDHRFNLLRRLR